MRLLLCDPTTVKEIMPDKVCKCVSANRINQRDELCCIEDKLYHARYFWRVDDMLDFATQNFINFVKGDITVVSDNIQFLFSLPYTSINDSSAIDKINALHDLYSSQFFEKLNFDIRYANYPNGCMCSDIAFVGEAPGWHDDPSFFNARIYVFGQSSIVFRVLSSVVFGKAWYTNISKVALRGNPKLTTLSTLDMCIDALYSELQLFNIHTIICLGNSVYDILCNTYSKKFKDFKLYKIFHPAYIYRIGNNTAVYLDNMLSVKKIMEEQKCCKIVN